MRPLLFALPAQESLARSLLRELPAEAATFELRSFPDLETYLRVTVDVRERAVAILCTLQQPNRWAMPLMFLAQTLRELGARQVGLVAPYLAYMRQDRRFQPGEAVTSEIFAKFVSAHMDWLVTVDPHLHRRTWLGEIYDIPTAVAHAAPLLGGWIRGHVDRPLVVGPDAESEQWVRAVAEAVPCPHVVFEKVRRGDRDVSVASIPGINRWNGCTPVLVDDVISTAHTLGEAVVQLRAARFASPVCIGVHGVFADDALETLQRAGAGRVVTTNTIAHESNAIDVGPLLAESARVFLTAREHKTARTARRRVPHRGSK